MHLQPSGGRSGRDARSEGSLRRGGVRGPFLVAAYVALLSLPALAPILGASAAVPPPVELGVNETTAFMFALDGAYGYNQNFPSGPDTKVSAPTPNADTLWKEYFRYFLHYQGTGTPPLKMVRIAVGFDFGNEETYSSWKANPAAYYAVFDPMVTWAANAGVHLTPVIMHCTQNTANSWPANRYVTESLRTSHLVEFSRALMTRYESSSAIVMWDLLNEPTPHPGDGMVPWVANVVSQVRSATAKPITMGFDAEFTFSQSELTNLMAPLDVWQTHIYADLAFATPGNLDILQSWAAAAGKPWFLGELGTNVNTGYFPAVTIAWLARGIGPVGSMALWNGGIGGAYADYPYFGTLPAYSTSTSFDFSVSLNPTSGVVLQGQTATSTVSATLLSGTGQAVNFTASGLPAGAGASLNPVTCTPSCSSTMTITTAPSTPTGTYQIPVLVGGGGVNRSVTYSLSVNAPCPSLPPSYPSTSWDRVWCDSGLAVKLADAPDEPNEKFDNNWGRGAVAGIRADNIGFRSGRTLNVATAGNYTFTAGADDGIRMWIDGTAVLDQWIVQAYTTYDVTKALTAGAHTVRIDYYEGVSDARVSFTYTVAALPDTTAPAQVTDLNATSTGTQSVALRWTAPGDDGTLGRASTYDIRYSSAGPIDASNFPLATRVTSAPPGPAGTLESMSVTGLAPATRYWFALKTGDEVPNWSPLSNVPDATTQSPPPPDTTPPARVADLNATATGTQTVSLRWTAPGDDGSSGRATTYDARYTSSGPLTDATFASAIRITTSAPGTSGTAEAVTVAGLSPGTRYWFALKTADEVPNWSTLSNVVDAVTASTPDTTPPGVGLYAPANGATASGDVLVSAWATDDVSVASVSLYADAGLVGTSSSPPYQWTWQSASVADGVHRLTVLGGDTSGNSASAFVDVLVSNAPPVSPRVTFAAWDTDHAWVEIVFSKPMNRTSVETNLQTTPITEHSLSWANDTHLFIVLTGTWSQGQRHVVTIDAAATDLEGVTMSSGFT